MQPAFIRVIDNIRKLLDVSAWKGTYKDVLTWPQGVDPETQALVTELLQRLETAPPEQAEQIREHLATLPMPHPGYHLCLQRQEQQVTVDLWNLCYQVCFYNYQLGDEKVDIDTDLIDADGEVIEVHTELPENLERINEDPYDFGWIVKVKLADDSGADSLMDHAAYQKQCAESG